VRCNTHTLCNHTMTLPNAPTERCAYVVHKNHVHTCHAMPCTFPPSLTVVSKNNPLPNLSFFPSRTKSPTTTHSLLIPYQPKRAAGCMHIRLLYVLYMHGRPESPCPHAQRASLTHQPPPRRLTLPCMLCANSEPPSHLHSHSFIPFAHIPPERNETKTPPSTTTTTTTIIIISSTKNNHQQQPSARTSQKKLSLTSLSSTDIPTRQEKK
jgi:hypothetical protein